MLRVTSIHQGCSCCLEFTYQSGASPLVVHTGFLVRVSITEKQHVTQSHSLLGHRLTPPLTSSTTESDLCHRHLHSRYLSPLHHHPPSPCKFAFSYLPQASPLLYALLMAGNNNNQHSIQLTVSLPQHHLCLSLPTPLMEPGCQGIPSQAQFC